MVMASEEQVVKKHSDLDIIRQRAEQAAEYYHNQVQPKPSSKGNSPEMYNSNGNRFYDKSSHGSTEDALLSGIAPASSSSFYRAKMKAGIIDMRSSMNERIGTGRSRTRMFPSQHANRPRPNQVTEMRSAVKAPMSVSEQVKMVRNNKISRNLYRSNSIEMDSMDHIEQDLPSPSNISARREYGSTSSLDLLGNNTSSDFFTMLKEYHNENPDQRSPAPPKLQELLQGNLTKGGRSMPITNGSVPFDKENEFNNDSPKSKSKSKHKDRKLRAKSITGEASAGILKKLRGTKPDTDIHTKQDEKSPEDNRSDERYRRKCLVHFDCQSVGVNLADVIKIKNYSGIVKNTSTGASAASVNRNSIAGDKDDPDIIAGTDDGDRKSNCLVLSCPFFRNEIGGEEERVISFTRNYSHHKRVHGTNYRNEESSAMDYHRHPTCCGVAILDSSPSPGGQILPPLVSHRGHVIEYVDHGCSYYRHYFYSYDHQNFFGCDDNLGPVAITIRREKLDTDERANNLGKADYGVYHYRIICRTSELTTLRGAVLEDAIPSSSRLSSSRGVPMKEVLEYIVPEVQLSCLRQATPGAKTSEQLLKLDEQALSTTYKIGIMYCKKGQCTEEEMYNNENGSPAFEEFLNLIGQKIRLKGFDKYRGGLDCKTESTGINSYYTTFNNCEVMFHVSTILPFTSNNIQQLFRKRHIGNDIVTIIFQEPGSLPFTPKTVRSQFQHVFIIIRVTNPNTEGVLYSMAVTRSKDVPPFGPPIPEKPFTKSPEFVDFLLAKLINAENAAHRSEKFRAMATRTRQEYLKDLALNYVSSTPLDNSSKLSKFALGSGRKKERTKQKVVPDLYAKGCLVWNIQAEDVGSASQVESYLAIASNTLVVIEESSKDVIFTVSCSSVIGWTPQSKSLRLFFSQGEYIIFKVSSGDVEEMHEIISRLTAVTLGCETTEMTLKRNGLGQLGFHIQTEGIVTDVEAYGFAWEAGLRKGSRLVEICKVSTATLSHDQTVDILRTSSTVKVVVVHPLEDGNPRGFMTLNNQAQYSSLMALNTTVLLSENSQTPKDGQSNQQRNSNTLPRRSRGEVKPSSVRSINNENKNNNYDYHPRQMHNYNDSNVSSGRSSDEGRTYYNNLRHDGLESNSRVITGEGHTSSGEDLHSRTSSHDSSEYSYTGVNNRQWPPRSVSNHIQPHNNTRRVDLSDSSHNIYPNISESSSAQSSNMQRRNFNPSTAFSQADYAYTGVPVTGNIALELLKQSQNTKYLLSKSSDLKHGRSSGDLPTSSMSLSQMSESLYNSIGTRRSYMEQKINNKDDMSHPRRKESAPAMMRIKNPSHNRNHLDVSPHSSNNSSPRSSNKNLSGMSSEESLNARHKSGLKHKTSPSSNFQEELMRLINLDISDTDLSNYAKLQNGSDRQRSRRLQRTMSDESLHNSKGVLLDGGNTYTSALPAQVVSTQREELSKEQRLSPRAMLNMAPRPRSRTTVIDGRSVPIPDSAAGLDWSDLVNVATKAIGDDQSRKIHGLEDEPPPRPPSPQDKLSCSSGPSGMMWRSIASSPEEHIQELQNKFIQMQQQLEQEQRKNSSLENEVQNLREENIRLQEESQTAAAQLRRFTEWFFSTI